MDSTATHWTHAQGLGVMTPIDQNSCPRPADTNSNNNIINNNNQNKRSNPTSTLARPQKDQALNCPRCNSTNTKFCYYNNYSLSQPRYFCKTCRRYWTEGGSLRNVPVGGGSRKNRRPSSSSSSASSSPSSSKNIIHKLPDDLIINNNNNNSTKNPTTNTISTSSSSSENPKIIPYEASHDLNLAYPPITTLGSSSSTSSSGLLSLGSFITTMPPSLVASSHDHHSNNLYASGGLFPFLEFKPTLNFSLDGFDTTGFVTSTQTTSTAAAATAGTTNNNNGVSELEQNKGLGGGSSTGYWNAMFP